MIKTTKMDIFKGRIRKLAFYFRHPQYAQKYAKRFSSSFSQADLECCVKNMYEFRTGKKLDLDNVNTFNEKLNWLKCFYHDERMTECADKVSAPSYFRKHTGLDDSFIVKNLGVFDSPEEIDFDALPNQFVLKSNWGSGTQIIVKNKKKVNYEQIKEKMKSWNSIETNHYYHGFEYGYKNIVPKIVCEEYIDFEYKMEFFCFDGTPHYFWTVYNDKTDEVCANFYDAKTLEKLDVRQGYPNSSEKLNLPTDYDDMLLVASNLSKGFPFVRIDFFKTKTGFKFSEMTFYHWCGFMPFDPVKYDIEFGNKLILPKKRV